MKKDEKKKDQTKDPAAEEQKTTGNQTEDPEKDEEETSKNTEKPDDEVEAGNSEDGADAEVSEQQTDTEQSAEGTDASLDDVLRNPNMKAAFDARVQSAVDAAIAKATDEAEKMANMTPEEKAGYETAKKERELEAREKALLAREMKATAIEELGKEQLPAVLADCFNYESEETFRESKDAVIKAFQDAIKEAVNTRLRGNNAPKTAQEGADSAKTQNGSFAKIIKESRSRR